MKIEIIKGKEIEFIEQINLLKNLTNNEPHIQRLIDAISYDPNKADRLKHDDILPDIQFVKNIFERIDNRKKFNTKDAGKNYEFFTRGDFFKFIQTEHLSQIIGLKILWELLQNMHISNKRIRNKTELAFLSLEIAEEYENLFQKNMDEYLNSLEIRKSLLPDFPIEQVINSEYFYNLPFYINIEDHLVQISDEIPNTAENIEDILDNDTPLFINHDGRILKICKSTFGFTIETTSELGCLESISVKNLKFYYGLYIPNQTESGFINSNYPPSGLKLYRVSEIEQVPERAQAFYNVADKLTDALNPFSYEPKEVKKVKNTFLSLIYHIVKSAFVGKKVSEHLIQTISGFIALDMGIIDLDIEYLPSDNLRVNNESLRKTVSWAIKSNNKLTSDS